jgi:hypothetical protein
MSRDSHANYMSTKNHKSGRVAQPFAFFAKAGGVSSVGARAGGPFKRCLVLNGVFRRPLAGQSIECTYKPAIN